MSGPRSIFINYALPVLAATIPVAALLILFDVHSAVIRRAQTLIGVRPDTPVIISTRDACGHTETHIRAIVRNDRELSPTDARGCNKTSVSVLAAKRPGEVITLYLNNEPVARDRSPSRIVRFDDIALDQAVNILQLTPDEGLFWRPFGSSGRPAEFIDYFGQRFEPPWSLQDRPGPLPLGRIGINGPEAPTAIEELGVWTNEDGEFVGLVSGAPVSTLPTTTFGINTQDRRLTNPAGLTLVKITPEAAEGKPAPPFFRRLRLERHSDGTIAVDAKTCLPRGHPYHARVLPPGEESAPGILPIPGTIFVARFFNVQVGRFTRETLFAAPDKVAVHFTAEGPAACRPVSASFTLKHGGFVLSQEGLASFPKLPGDELELVGFGDAVDESGRVASAATSETRRWHGPGQVAERYWLDLRYYSSSGPDAHVEAADDRIFTQYRQIFEALPDQLRTFLFLAAPIMPALLILFVVKTRVRTEDTNEEALEMATRGLYALVFFGAAYALQPFVHSFAYWLIDVVRIGSSIRDLTVNIYTRSSESVPTAILVVVLALVMLDRDPNARRGSDSPMLRGLGYLINLVLSAGLIALGIGALRIQYLATNEEFAGEIADFIATIPQLGWVDTQIFSGVTGPLWLTLLWSVLITLLATFTVSWVLRSLSAPVRLRTAFGATVTIFFVVLIPTLADTLALTTAIIFHLGSIDGFLAHSFMTASEFAATHAPQIILFLLSYLVLRRLIALFRKSTDLQVRISTSAVAVIIAFAVTVSLAGQVPSGQKTLNADVILLTGLAQSYVPLMALLLGYFVLKATRPRLPGKPGGVVQSGPPDPFELPESVYLLCGAAFAGYVATWSLNPVTLIPVLVVGWFIFRYFIVVRPGGREIPFYSTFAARYLDYLREAHLALQIRDTARKALAKGDIDQRSYTLRINQANNRDRKALETLPAKQKFVKAMILGRGPGKTPLQNGLRGSAAGLVMALVLQALLPLNASLQDLGVQSGWLTFAKILLTETQYGIVRESGAAPAVWLALARILNALILWVTAGFLFGYVFHRIKGDDGFVKAVKFSLGVALAVLVAQAITGGGAVALAAQVLPLSVFLLVTGVIVFDAASLREQELSYADLVEIYGLKTSVGYASIAGALAALQPLLTILGWIG